MGSGEPLVLLHGVMGSERMWQDVARLLAADHDVVALTALGHAGGWGASGPRAKRLREGLRIGRLTRPALPVLYHSRAVRQFALRNVAANGAALSADHALRLTDDMLGCQIAEDLLATDEHFAPLHPAPCPITIAWCELDRIFAEGEFGARARERVPSARYVVLKGVCHVPMLDNPRLVATVIGQSRDASH